MIRKRYVLIALVIALAATAALGAKAKAQLAADFSATTAGSVRLGWDGQACNAARAGAVRYNSSGSKYLEYCDGTSWNVAAQTGGTLVKPPSGSGYFVMSQTTYNGNLGGLVGADAACLTEIGTTHTGWKGYADASSRGLLTSTKVHAFICTYSACNNLMPLTTYYFANAANSSLGGGYFTTDSNGNGPNDTVDWAATNYFGGTYRYWSGRAATSNSLWGGPTSGTGECSSLTTSASGTSGEYGNTTMTLYQRWYGITVGSTSCNNTLNLVCLVNP